MDKNLNMFHEMGAKIEKYVRPATFPLAVKVIKSGSDQPSQYKRPSVDLNLRNFVCQNFKMSRTYGWTIEIREEDINCLLARSIYGWDPVTEETVKWSNAFSVGLYAKDTMTSEKLFKHLYRFDEEIQGLVISPLARTKVVPDVVLIYCLPAQAMRFIQGYLYVEGGVLEFSSAGKIGSCHEGIVKAIVTNQPQMVMLGNGDRVWGGAQDSEVMFACPYSKLNSLMEGLEATHNAGLRYPVPQYMNYAPGFQAEFEQKADQRAGGTIAKKD
ncbi:MAG: DUF169 domain-containing protein [Desulfobacteraceae bacterium]|nr:DUF169 domain-containing protein [Desulfobacteraceae bacterium]